MTTRDRTNSESAGQKLDLSRVWYSVMWCFCWSISKFWFRFQCSGRQHVPKTGPILLLSNHQSNLDPVLVGVACPRQLRYLAKKALFFWPLSWLIRSLGAVPIDLHGSAISGLKTMLRLLKQDEAVLVFPEGSRTPNGKLQPFKAGFCPLARRSGAAIVPVAIEGAFHSLPLRARFPRPVQIALQFGPPIMPSEIAALGDEQLVELVAARVAAAMPSTA
jgi:1-acyl-sn-glycerol-3-phosphate acyltransferase